LPIGYGRRCRVRGGGGALLLSLLLLLYARLSLPRGHLRPSLLLRLQQPLSVILKKPLSLFWT
jgi:hypothetical protein